MIHITGTIVQIYDVETIETKYGEKQKQMFKLDQGDLHYPEVVITVMGEERISRLANRNVGDYVEVACYINSREYNGKFYHNINGWSIFDAKVLEKDSSKFVTGDDTDMPF